MKVLAVIPAYNEQTTIGSVISEVKKYVDEVVVVNDGSADQTQTLAEAAGALVISHAINRGQGAALQTGISYALSRQAEVIVTFDADGQHQAAEIPLLIEPIKNGEAEIVLGSRFLNKKHRHWTTMLPVRVTATLECDEAHLSVVRDALKPKRGERVLEG